MPFLVNGYSQCVLHLTQAGDEEVACTVEAGDGHGRWTKHAVVRVPAKGYAWHILPTDHAAEWVRITADKDCSDATAYFLCGPVGGTVTDRRMFVSLADAGGKQTVAAGAVRARGDDRGTLLYAPEIHGTASNEDLPRLLEIGPDMKFRSAAKEAAEELKDKAAKPAYEVSGDAASVILVQGKQRFRLPKGDAAFDRSGAPSPRIREVVTERSLVNAHGSFYVIPRPNSGGAARIKPICTHNKLIADFASWRGLLVLTGNRTDATPDGHYFAAQDGKTGLWFGDIDDLWKLGKPCGHGGPWLNSAVSTGTPSDPYLMAGYDRKSLELSHRGEAAVRFTVEVSFDGTNWYRYRSFDVPAGKTLRHQFPTGYQAHWVRVVADRDCTATAIFKYE